MKWRFLIWFFLPVISLFFNNTVKAQTNFVPEFKDFPIGISYKALESDLERYSVTLINFEPHIFSLPLPVYDLLSSLKAHNASVDVTNERIYYDDEVFFDLKNVSIKNNVYSFYYKDPAYILSVNTIKSYDVDYPSRVNENLKNLSFKFFNNTLYAIEYKAKLDKNEIIRLRGKYIREYEEILMNGENHFFTKTGSYFVKFNSPTKGDVDVIIMGKKEFSAISNYLDAVVNRAIYDIVGIINNELNTTQDIKLLLLQERKNKLISKLHARYGEIDEL